MDDGLHRKLGTDLFRRPWTKLGTTIPCFGNILVGTALFMLRSDAASLDQSDLCCRSGKWLGLPNSQLQTSPAINQAQQPQVLIIWEIFCINLEGDPLSWQGLKANHVLILQERNNEQYLTFLKVKIGYSCYIDDLFCIF
jgi:hypothetical protein